MSTFSGVVETRPRASWPRSRHGWLVLGLLLTFPSAGFVQKHAGLGGLFAYVIAALAVVFTARKLSHHWMPWFEQHFRVLSGVSFAGLVLCFSFIYPIENNKGPGKSSDRDEGLNMAVTRMTEGRTPYYPSNNVAGPLSVLPGSIALSAPFVALGNSAYQNLFWLPVFCVSVLWLFRSKSLALALLIIPLALSPAAQYEFISGGDLISNGIFVAVISLFMLRSWVDPSAPAWRRWLSCLLLGVALASRANFVLLIPLVGAVLWQLSEPRHAILATSFVGLTLLAITLPFYLSDPSGFTPLLSRHKLSAVNHALPWAGNAMMGATVVAALACAGWLMRTANRDPIQSFFRCCTWVTLTPIVCMVLLSSSLRGYPDLSFLEDRFGLMYVFFALLGWGESWLSIAVTNGLPKEKHA